MNVQRWILMLGVVLFAARLDAQESTLQSRLDAETYKGVSAVIRTMTEAGIPSQSIVSKALEGASKGASGERIIAAVRRLAGHLVVARQSLGPTATAAELDAAAAALHIGIAPAQLERLRAERPRQSLTVPLGMLADLVARGVPTDSAGAAVLALARTNMRDEDFVAFRRNVERDIALGAPPAAAASMRVNATMLDAFANERSTSERSATPRKP